MNEKQKEDRPDQPKKKRQAEMCANFRNTYMHKKNTAFGGSFFVPSSSDVDTKKSPQGAHSPIRYPSASNPHQGRVGGYTPSTHVSYGSVVQSVYVLPLYINGKTHGSSSIVLRWSGSQLDTLSSGVESVMVQGLHASQVTDCSSQLLVQNIPPSSTEIAHKPKPSE